MEHLFDHCHRFGDGPAKRFCTVQRRLPEATAAISIGKQGRGKRDNLAGAMNHTAALSGEHGAVGRGKVEGVRPGQHRAAELRRFQRILSAMGNQTAADETETCQAVEEAEFPLMVQSVIVINGDTPISSATVMPHPSKSTWFPVIVQFVTVKALARHQMPPPAP